VLPPVFEHWPCFAARCYHRYVQFLYPFSLTRLPLSLCFLAFRSPVAVRLVLLKRPAGLIFGLYVAYRAPVGLNAVFPPFRESSDGPHLGCLNFLWFVRPESRPRLFPVGVHDGPSALVRSVMSFVCLCDAFVFPAFAVRLPWLRRRSCASVQPKRLPALPPLFPDLRPFSGS